MPSVQTSSEGPSADAMKQLCMIILEVDEGSDLNIIEPVHEISNNVAF